MIDIGDIELIGTRLEEEGIVTNFSRNTMNKRLLENSRARGLLKKMRHSQPCRKQIIGVALEMGMAERLSVRLISG
jgi:hypothetical protein